MSELRAEAINLIENMPEEYLPDIVEKIQDLLFEKIEEEADKNYELWNSDPDKYEDKINEYVNFWIKDFRRRQKLKCR